MPLSARLLLPRRLTDFVAAGHGDGVAGVQHGALLGRVERGEGLPGGDRLQAPQAGQFARQGVAGEGQHAAHPGLAPGECLGDTRRRHAGGDQTQHRVGGIFQTELLPVHVLGGAQHHGRGADGREHPRQQGAPAQQAGGAHTSFTVDQRPVLPCGAHADGLKLADDFQAFRQIVEGVGIEATHGEIALGLHGVQRNGAQLLRVGAGGAEVQGKGCGGGHGGRLHHGEGLRGSGAGGAAGEFVLQGGELGSDGFRGGWGLLGRGGGLRRLVVAGAHGVELGGAFAGGHPVGSHLAGVGQQGAEVVSLADVPVVVALEVVSSDGRGLLTQAAGEAGELVVHLSVAQRRGVVAGLEGLAVVLPELLGEVFFCKGEQRVFAFGLAVHRRRVGGRVLCLRDGGRRRRVSDCSRRHGLKDGQVTLGL